MWIDAVSNILLHFSNSFIVFLSIDRYTKKYNIKQFQLNIINLIHYKQPDYLLHIIILKTILTI